MTGSSPFLGFFHGLRTLPRAVGVLRRSPRLVRWLLYPLGITIAIYSVGFYLALQRTVTYIQTLDIHRGESAGYIAYFLLGIAGVALALLVVGMTFTMVYLVVSGPFQESMSGEVEAVVRGAAGEAPSGFGSILRGLWYGLRQALILLPLNLLMLLLGLIPAVGPVVALSWSAFSLGYTLLEVPANRRVLPFHAKRGMALRHLGATFGIGLPAALLSLLPLIYIGLLPVFVVAGTLLFLDIAAREEASTAQPEGP